MFQVLKRAEIFAPVYLGKQDLWLCNGSIVAMGPDLPALPSEFQYEEMDLKGARLIPGLIDAHVHATGGGGEDGPATRVPPLKLNALTRAGVTSCVGVLGTDTTTRTMRDLVATTLGIREQGISAWCYTGGYQVPPATLTGSVRDDIVFIDPIIGVGELAISDHRSSQPTLDEFLRIASDAYVAGIISRKAGIMHIHMGDGVRAFELIHQALENTEIPARVYHPTHANRQRKLFDAAPELAARGVTIDVTAFPADEESFSAAEAIDRWLHAKQPAEKITCSSDGAGCLPEFDADGRLLRMGIGDPASLSETLKELLDNGHELSSVLPIFTTNVAKTLSLPKKGEIKIGYDADLVVLSESGEVQSVMALGEWRMVDREIKKPGIFEE